jgi:ABC-type cobalamin/Fe3+-siderophores transport system ATPase subunit
MSRGQRQYLIAGKAELELDIIILRHETLAFSDEGLTILHAPNGTGKTALLETLFPTVAALANDEGRFCELH